MTMTISNTSRVNKTNLSYRGKFFAFLALAIVGKIAVESWFTAARFPVPLIEGQLAFKAELIKGYYATLIAQGTFGTYVQTQLIDYIWIVGLAATGYFLHKWLMGGFRPKSFMHRYHSIAMWILPLGGLMDGVENVVSFFMLANPTDFADWLAPLYSSLAAAKWVLDPAGMIVGLVGAILSLGFYLYQRYPLR